MKIPYEALLPFYHWVWSHWREKRWNKSSELVEPHFLGLFIHWFPRFWHVPLARWTSVVGLTGAADLTSIASTTRLLTKKQYRKLFPDWEIWTERLFLIFPKFHIAIQTDRVES